MHIVLAFPGLHIGVLLVLLLLVRALLELIDILIFLVLVLLIGAGQIAPRFMTDTPELLVRKPDEILPEPIQPLALQLPLQPLLNFDVLERRVAQGAVQVGLFLQKVEVLVFFVDDSQQADQLVAVVHDEVLVLEVLQFWD